MKSSSYKCYHCGGECFNKRMLQSHIKRKHIRVLFKTQCPHCYFRGTDLISLKKHLLRKHPKVKKLWCPYCYYETSIPFSLKLHVKYKHFGGKHLYKSSFNVNVQALQKLDLQGISYGVLGHNKLGNAEEDVISIRDSGEECNDSEDHISIRDSEEECHPVEDAISIRDSEEERSSSDETIFIDLIRKKDPGCYSTLNNSISHNTNDESHVSASNNDSAYQNEDVLLAQDSLESVPLLQLSPRNSVTSPENALNSAENVTHLDNLDILQRKNDKICFKCIYCKFSSSVLVGLKIHFSIKHNRKLDNHKAYLEQLKHLKKPIDESNNIKKRSEEKKRNKCHNKLQKCLLCKYSTLSQTGLKIHFTKSHKKSSVLSKS